MIKISFIFILSTFFITSSVIINHSYVLANECVNYDIATKTIDVMCGSFNLIQLEQELDSKVLLSEEKVWLLSANLQIGEDATLFINSTDVDWLKITGDSKEEFYGIINHGTLIIDNTKISSWNPKTNDYVPQLDNGTIKRPYITSLKSQGSMNITNSEISYLGFHHSPEQGLSYHFSNNSKIDNNEIHNLWYGFYTDASHDLNITNNHVHHNFKYGLDPHTKSYNLLIQNNTVHDTKVGIGIICSLDCYNITIENNTVYNNKNAGIMFSRNMTDSIVRNNIVYDEIQGISISESYHNQIYGNFISNSTTGIHVKLLRPLEYNRNLENDIYNNTITNSYIAIRIDSGVSKNYIYNNKITNSESAGIKIYNFTNTGNKIYDNSFSQNKYAIYAITQNDSLTNKFVGLASLWCENKLNYSNEIQYLFYSNEIKSSKTFTETMIFPSWIKNDVCWWSEGLISDKEFESTIEYLINKETIRIKLE